MANKLGDDRPIATEFGLLWQDRRNSKRLRRSFALQIRQKNRVFPNLCPNIGDTSCSKVGFANLAAWSGDRARSIFKLQSRPIFIRSRRAETLSPLVIQHLRTKKFHRFRVFAPTEFALAIVAITNELRSVFQITRAAHCGERYVDLAVLLKPRRRAQPAHGTTVAGKPRIFMALVGFPDYVKKCEQVENSGYEGFVFRKNKFSFDVTVANKKREEKMTYYSEERHGPHYYFDLGAFELESGITLPNAKLAYKTFGSLNQNKDNAILFPHMWSGTSKAMEIFLGSGRPLDPDKYFIILPGQFANGFSSSPSNTPPPFNGGNFPHVNIGDDVRAQHRLVTELFGIKRLELVLGWSMGAEQTYEWAVRFPEMVKRALPFAGTARTTPHDYIFVRSHEDAIKSDPAWNNGFYKDQSDVHLGLRRHAQTWSVMGLCPDFYNLEAWRDVGYSSLEDFLTRFWEGYFAPMDPNNLIWMGWKWRHGDVSRHTGGNLAAALGRIKARTLVVAFSGDMFFPPADIEAEQKLIPNSRYREVKSLWAHFAMFCIAKSDQEQIDSCIRDLLQEAVA